MSKQDTIFPGTDTPVIFDFTFTGDFAASGLNNFTEVKATLGAEVYSTVDDPTNIAIESATELSLSIGTVTALTSDTKPIIVGYSVTYPNGYTLSSGGTGTAQVRASECRNPLVVKVCS